MTKPDVSIITVHYKANRETFNFIHSLTALQGNFELILVDNDCDKEFTREITRLKSLLPIPINYISTKSNHGFGYGCNIGSTYSRGRYLFFLNPDCLVFPNTLTPLINLLESDPQIGIVAPVLLDQNHHPYSLQGTTALTPLTGIFALSFINKLWPQNPISYGYWLKCWDKESIHQVSVVPGTAFMISKEIFNRIGGFDPKYFMYFEESDLCLRLTKYKYRIFIQPESKVVHLWGKSSGQSDKLLPIFLKSRFYYFHKNFGLLSALLVEFFCRITLPKFIRTILSSVKITSWSLV